MTPLVIESWIWWAIVLLVALSRFISRRMVFGSVKGFQSDDYGMVVVLCFYTVLINVINVVRNTDSNLLPPGFDVASLTPEEIHRREYGSKLILVVEQCQCVTIWGAKCCLLILYLRLTTLRWENAAIKVLLSYVALSFIVMEILYFGVWCRPFHNYWAVPTPNVQCNAATDHLITNATFNLTSDLAMLAIGLPMFLRLNLPWQKKYPLILVFSLGIFVILAAILNKVYSFDQPFGDLWSFWYVRESSTALLVANLPFVWNFWRRLGGFSSVIGTTRKGTTHAATAVTVSRQQGSTPRECEMSEFITEWPLQDEKEGDDPLRRVSSKQSAYVQGDQDLTFEEALRMGDGLHVDESVAAKKNAHSQITPRRDSSSATTYSATPASLNGPSWSAGSFV